MREALKNVLENTSPQERAALHPALAYGNWTRLDGKTGKPASSGPSYVEALADLQVSKDYKYAFAAWKGALERTRYVKLITVKLSSRLLIGHGNVAPTDIGLTLHHSWGVPMIPGSSLKGLLSHYIDITYGPRGDRAHPDALQQDDDGAARSRFQGVTWNDGQQAKYPPGDVHRGLFGAPDTAAIAGLPAGLAERGGLIFHDALYVPGSAPGDRPLAADVLTVHQKQYYDNEGRRSPADYHDPVPVPFLTVRPGVKLLVALSASNDVSDSLGLCIDLMGSAMKEWGIGGKTSLGYGRMSTDYAPRSS